MCEYEIQQKAKAIDRQSVTLLHISNGDYEMNTSIHLILLFSLISPSLKHKTTVTLLPDLRSNHVWEAKSSPDGLYHSSLNHPSCIEAWFTEVTFLSYNSNPFSQALPPAVTLWRRRHDRVNVSLWTGLPASKLKWLPARCELQVNLLSVRGEYRGCALLIMLNRGEATAQTVREKQKTRRKNERGALVRVNNTSESHKTSQDHDQIIFHCKIKCERWRDRQRVEIDRKIDR